MQREKNARLSYEILDSFYFLEEMRLGRDANFVEIEVDKASHSKMGVNALLCQRHDLKSYSLFCSFLH